MLLRDYQQQAISNVFESYERGVRSGIVNLATGMGKSFLTTSLSQQFNKKYGGKTLFLVDQIELAHQAKRTFLATDPNLRVGIEMNNEHADPDDDVVIACVATLGRKGSKRIGRFKVSDFKVIVTDECFPGEVEVFTENGFVRFDSLTKSERVAQYHYDGTMGFVHPTRYVERPNTEDLVHLHTDKTMSVLCTKNHELVHRSVSKNVLVKEKADDLLLSTKYFRTAAIHNMGSDELTPWERLMIMLQADGSFHYESVKDGTQSYAFSFSKERKIKRFKEIMKAGGWKWSEVQGKSDHNKYRSRYLVSGLVGASKNIWEHFDLTKISAEKAEKIIQEMVEWDGSRGKNTDTSFIYYSSTDERCVDFYHAIAIMCGRRAKKTIQIDNRKESFNPVHRLFIRYGQSELHAQKIKKDYVPHNGTVYCVTVPTGMIMVRHNGCVMVVGNCHKSVSPIWLRTLHFLGVHPDNFADDKLLLGLTATAYRGDGKSLGYLYDDIFAQYDIRYGMKEGWLTDIEWISVKTDTNIKDVKVTAGEFSQLELAKTVDNPIRNSQIVKAYIENSNGEPAIVFCAGVQHAYTMAEMFNQAGIPSECVEGGTDKEVRKDWIGAYRNGDIKVLTNHSVFTTGFDAPETTTIIMARPIRSTLTYTQAIGRGLRPSASAMVDLFSDGDARRQAIEFSDKPACKLIDFEDNVGSHNVCRPPVLFGLNPNAKKKEKTKLFKDVVEVLDDVKIKSGIDVSKIVDLDNIHIISERKRLKLQAYSVDDVIKSMSTFMWLPVGEESYEMLLAKEGLALLVEPNMIGQFELHEINTKTNVARKMQTFASLQGAIKIADEYIKQNKFDVTFAKNDAAWLTKGVTFKQGALLSKLFKGGCRFGPGRYQDTQQLHVTINGRFLANAGEAATLLNQRLKK